MLFEKSANLRSRNYVGLLASQFLAAFNDHTSQIVAIFYASDMLVRYAKLPGVDEKLIVSIVTACFITPFFFFSPLAGVLADKYSKRSIIVFWKLAEVAIMGVAFFAFLLPHLGPLGWASSPTLATWSAWLLVAVVFLMGTHSAFFVPAKYGVMPEILQPTVLSRGNGLLEGTSFVAQIMGTAFGGVLYAYLKSDFGSVGQFEPGNEWIIGGVLLGLAVLGAAASFLIAPIPAAAPDRQLIWQPWTPLRSSFAILGRSRSLVLATAGIAFFLFMTLFLRQTLLFEGEADKELHHALADAGKPDPAAENAGSAAADIVQAPAAAGRPAASATQQAEFKVAMLISLVGLGVGIGCSLAGYLSGTRIELGLAPLGALLLVVLTAMLAWVVSSDVYKFICLVLIGVSAGLYIVPLYTLLQHRAPKESKGSLVALSNFLNVAGGLIAVVVFYFMTYGLQAVMGVTLTQADVERRPELAGQHIQQLEMQLGIPRILFLLASLITALMLYALCRQRPDFVSRSISWLTSVGRRHLEAAGLEHLPSTGPLIVVTNCDTFDEMIDVQAVTDRFTRFFATRPLNGRTGLLPAFVRRAGLLNEKPATGGDWASMQSLATETLAGGHAVALVVQSHCDDADGARLLDELRGHANAAIVPAYCGPCPARDRRRAKQHVVFGPPLEPQASWEELQAAIAVLGTGACETAVGVAAH